LFLSFQLGKLPAKVGFFVGFSEFEIRKKAKCGEGRKGIA
jgi:hypothetical protein